MLQNPDSTVAEKNGTGNAIAVTTVVSGFDIQTRLVGHSAYDINPLASFACLFKQKNI